VQIVAFPTAEQCIDFLKNKCGVRLIVGMLGCVEDGYDNYGYPVVVQREGQNGSNDLLARATTETAMNDVDVGDDNDNSFNSLLRCRRSYPVSSRPFAAAVANPPGNICFALSGKERGRRGLSLALAQQCDVFVHVPHVAIPEDRALPMPAPLLDIPSCISIALYHFTNWAGYDERTFQGHKFKVDKSCCQHSTRGGEGADELRIRRAEDKLRRRQEGEDGAALSTSLFE